MRGQHDLLRIVLTEEGSLAIGRTLPGRGAWLCAGSSPCLQSAVRRNALTRALRAPVSAESLLALEDELVR